MKKTLNISKMKNTLNTLNISKMKNTLNISKMKNTNKIKNMKNIMNINKMENMNKIQYINKNNNSVIKYLSYTIIIIIVILIILYLILYLIYVKPSYKIHELQTKEWIVDLTDTMITGINDYDKFDKIGKPTIFISFWYCYWFFHTKKYTIWILFNLQNKFSKIINLNIYLYNFENDNLVLEQISLDFTKLKTSKINNYDGNKLIINCGREYYQEIDFNKDISFLRIKTKNINFTIEVKIDDYKTNQASFIERYQKLLKYVDLGNKYEWMSDNPYIGKILGGTINNENIENNGNFWFDNYIGCNNQYLGPYTWFSILNDDWLIYLLWFETYDKRNNKDTVKPILIKDRKNDKYIYSSTVGFECSKNLFPINYINELLSPIRMTYESNKDIGNINYDDYYISFESNEIDIKINSIKDKCKRVFLYDYYKNDSTDNIIPEMNIDDKDYYEKLTNIKYVEYVNMVNVEVKYNNVTTQFIERQVIDSMYPINI